MDLEELRAFLAVVDTGSFLAAAIELGVPRGTLRRRVDALEARVGAPLLERASTGVRVTDAGALLAEQGRALVQESSALLSAVRKAAREPVGELRLHVPLGLPPHMFVPAFALMRATIPQLSLRIRFSEDPLAGLLDDVDVALHFGDESPSGRWIAHELCRVPLRLLAHADYLAERGTPRSVAELEEHTLLSWAMPGREGTRWPLCSGASLIVTPELISNDAHMLRQIVASAQGIGLLPDAAIPEPSATSTLVPVLEELVGETLALRLVVPTALARSPKVMRIVETIRMFMARL